MTNVIYITKAKDIGNLCVLLTFNDGTERTIDVGEFIRNHPHPMYNRHLGPKKFAKFKLDNGNIYWGKSEALAFHVEDLYDGHIG